jgi:hypothetical protein
MRVTLWREGFVGSPGGLELLLASTCAGPTPVDEKPGGAADDSKLDPEQPAKSPRPLTSEERERLREKIEQIKERDPNVYPLF